MQRILVTGANGHLGRRLIARLVDDGFAVSAVVRSQRAQGALAQALAVRATAERSLDTPESITPLEIHVLEYTDVDAIVAVARDCVAAVHLVGIIKETAGGRFYDAHEATTRALAVACGRAGIGRVVYLSIVGAHAESTNPCFTSKARAEEILLQSPVTAMVLRIPMVLGEDDYATGALRRRARSRWVLTFRGASLEQPIYAGDVVDAVLAGLVRHELSDCILMLGGAESLTRRSLIQRAGAAIDRRPLVFSIPLPLGLALAWLLERITANPPVSRAMLGVLDHDDQIDNERACGFLDLSLTPLDEMLAKLIP